MKKIILKDYGIIPGTDCTEQLAALFSEHSSDTEFVFEGGDYHFSPKIKRSLMLSNTDVIPERKLGILLENMKNIRLTGDHAGGTRLLFEGQMQAFTMLGCEDITVSGFTVDWEKPLVAEGIVTAYDADSVELFISPDAFPHRVTDGVIAFDVGNGEFYPMGIHGQMQYDGNTRTVRRANGDRFRLGRLIEEKPGSVYRFEAKNQDTAIGNIIVIRHNDRQHAGIFTEKCRRITIDHVTVHSCGGLGCLAQFCEDLTYRRVNFTPNIAAGRKVSNGRDDGMHITCCSGTVTITECTFVGLMDDPINVHGCCVTADEWIDRRTVRCRYMHHQACGFDYWAEAGDEIAFIERQGMTKISGAEAVSYELESHDTFILRFRDNIDPAVLSLDPKTVALDNLTHTASFVCTKNRFGSCRARGILVSTPKPVLIADNLFQSSGSAILVAGDSNYWFESGECHDVEICGNIFTDTCLSSMYQFCEGMISICPVVPVPDINAPYHKNIRIHDNTFDSPDTPVLYGFSTDGLKFTDNRIFRSTAAEKWHPGGYMINLSCCRNVNISGNLVIGDFTLGTIHEENCTDIRTDMR